MGICTRSDAMTPLPIQQVPLDRVTQAIYARIYAAMAPLRKEMEKVQDSAAILTGVFAKFWESLPILDAPAYVAMREQLAVVSQDLQAALKVPFSMPTRILAAQLVFHDLPRLAAIAVKLNSVPWMALGLIAGFGVLVGRFFCGWICPMGLLQDLGYLIPAPKLQLPSFLRWMKYAFLIFGVGAVAYWNRERANVSTWSLATFRAKTYQLPW